MRYCMRLTAWHRCIILSTHAGTLSNVRMLCALHPHAMQGFGALDETWNDGACLQIALGALEALKPCLLPAARPLT